MIADYPIGCVQLNRLFRVIVRRRFHAIHRRRRANDRPPRPRFVGCVDCRLSVGYVQSNRPFQMIVRRRFHAIHRRRRANDRPPRPRFVDCVVCRLSVGCAQSPVSRNSTPSVCALSVGCAQSNRPFQMIARRRLRAIRRMRPIQSPVSRDSMPSISRYPSPPSSQ